jgi:hypothetical protein
MQLVKIAFAIVAVALTPSEGAENHAVNRALLSQQVANHLRGLTDSTMYNQPESPRTGDHPWCGVTHSC